MKKCPFCHAEIEDNAHFCLYCMTSLEEKQSDDLDVKKNNLWVYILIAVLVLGLIIFCILAFFSNDDTKNSSSNKQHQSNLELESIDKTENILHNSSDELKPNEESTDTMVDNYSSKNEVSNQNNSTNQSTNVNTSKENETSSDNNYNSTPSTTTSSSNITSTESATSSTSSNETPSTKPNASKEETPTESTPSQSEPKYTYIEATLENAYPTGYSSLYAPENAIVITKVDYIEESGNYVIPELIDGKKVAAIMPQAFCDPKISSTVKSVTLPKTVRTIWSNAFKDCVNLKDVYIKSEAIGIYNDAFPEVSQRLNTLVFHCARNCRNFNFYYYRNIADDYGATYEEWNG